MDTPGAQSYGNFKLIINIKSNNNQEHIKNIVLQMVIT